jgi:hypothetical protein
MKLFQSAARLERLQGLDELAGPAFTMGER